MAKIGDTLPEGAVVSTGEDGRIVLEIAPEIVVELQPGTQLTIGSIEDAAATDTSGNPIPRVSLNLMSGGLVIHARDNGLASAALVVVTPDGNFSPTGGGMMVVSLAPASASDSGLAVASVTGTGIVTSKDGAPLPLSEGLMAVLDGNAQKAETVTVSGSLRGTQLSEAGQTSAARVQNFLSPAAPSEPSSPAPLSRTVATAPAPAAIPSFAPTPSPTPTPRPRGSPSPTPAPEPSPSPTPTPRPRPSPSPTPTPTPSPSPSPSHTP